jgi:hypothetical protein
MKTSDVKANMKADIRQTLKGGEGGAGFLSLTQVARYTGIGVNHVKAYMEGYEYIRIGRRCAFPIDSVVDRLMKDRRMA